jgi:hypothetical protein
LKGKFCFCLRRSRPFGFGFGFGFGFAVGVFLLASALRFRGAGVAPVRGGTYFSLPRQRKVGKRKPLHTASACFCPRAPNGPALHPAAHWFVLVANASNGRLTHFNHP